MQKLYYSIKEVSQLVDEEQHILRYWEKEFKTLKPKKNSAGNRKFNQKDIELISKIKTLLRDNKISLAEAKDVIDNKKKIDIKYDDGNLFSINSVLKDKPLSIAVQKSNLIKELELILKETIEVLKS